MAKISIAPQWDAFNNQLWFPTNEINTFMREIVYDKMSIYMALYRPYSWMRLTKLMRYRLHELRASTSLWQAHNSCQWKPTGTLVDGQRELFPEAIMLQEQKCYDNFFGTNYEQFLTYPQGGGLVEIDPNGQRLMAEGLNVLLQNAAVGFRELLATGQRIDYGGLVPFEPTLGTDFRELIKRTANSIKGWLQLLVENAVKPGLSHLNVPDVIDPVNDFNGDGKFIANVVDKFDILKGKAPSDLRRLMRKVRFKVGSNDYWVQFQVSEELHARLEEEYIIQGTLVAQNEPRITRREVPWQGEMYDVYFIDRIPVVPMEDVSCINDRIEGTLFYAAITISENIALGGSFTDIPEADEPGFALAVQRDQALNRYGQVYYTAHALASTQLNDTRYYTGTQVIIT